MWRGKYFNNSLIKNTRRFFEKHEIVTFEYGERLDNLLSYFGFRYLLVVFQYRRTKWQIARKNEIKGKRKLPDLKY
jgi:hypothetical protein